MSAPDRPQPRPLPREAWEHDDAHQALDQWVWAWRQKNPDAALPRVDFAKHLGLEAVELMNSGMSKVELARLFWACAEDGVCPCGNRWDQRVPVLIEEVA